MEPARTKAGQAACTALTFGAVSFCWIFFRSESLNQAFFLLGQLCSPWNLAAGLACLGVSAGNGLRLALLLALCPALDRLGREREAFQDMAYVYFFLAIAAAWLVRLQQGGAEGRRIVVVGGSGAAFGVRSDLLEEALPGYSAVNFGLYAGLGTTVMLDLARPLLREGDIIIFSPDQSEQTLSTYFNAQAMWQAADGRPELLPALGADRLGAMAGAFPVFAGDKARLFRDGSAPAGEGVYARSSFNAYGDIGWPGREQNGMAGGFDPNMMISFDPDLPSEDFFRRSTPSPGGAGGPG